jgi:hypothetical protein
MQRTEYLFSMIELVNDGHRVRQDTVPGQHGKNDDDRVDEKSSFDRKCAAKDFYAFSGRPPTGLRTKMPALTG